MYTVASHLHKTVEEVLGMTVAEYQGWLVYLGEIHGGE